MSSTACPHGLPRSTCEICRILEPTALPDTRSPRRNRPAWLGGLPGGLAAIGVVAVVGFVVFGWVMASVFAALRVIELLAVAIVAGWVGWKLGVRHEKRHR